MVSVFNITNRKGVVFNVTLDDEDTHIFTNSEYKWYISVGKTDIAYVKRHTKTSMEFLHRVILEAHKGIGVDHIDGNLNNTKSNLRSADQRQNNGNRRKNTKVSSKFKGGIF